MSPATVPAAVVAGGDLRQVFRDLPQPVAVVTGLGPAGEPVGMTVSSLTSASLVPPLILFCPAVTSRAWAAARERGSFAVNILGHQHAGLAIRFARPGDRFAGVRTLPADDGLPVLADALTVLVCDIAAEHPAGDHTVVLGRLRAVHALRDGVGMDTVSLRGKGSRHTGDRPRSCAAAPSARQPRRGLSEGGAVMAFWRTALADRRAVRARLRNERALVRTLAAAPTVESAHEISTLIARR